MYSLFLSSVSPATGNVEPIVYIIIGIAAGVLIIATTAAGIISKKKKK